MKIFVGCSSSNDIDKKHLEVNKQLLDLILQENDLVFGASNNGIMGLAYNSAINHGKQITGICPEAYKDDLKSLKCTKEITTNSISERTKMLIEESDLLLFLPGGIGTYFELFSAIESKRCHEFDKPIIIFNSNGFFDKFKEMMEQNYRERFSKQSDSLNYVIANTIQEVKEYCEKYKKSQEIADYKSDYEYGLTLLKDSLNEVNRLPYRAMLTYFNYPLSIIEDTVEKARNSKTDTNEFYKEQCDNLLEMYDRLLKTYLICQSEIGTKEEKKRANEILKAIKSQSNPQDKNLNKEEPVEHIDSSKKGFPIKLLSRFKK